jgi:phosphohistidine phosphatase SixA
MNSIEILFIRHAESKENQKNNLLSEGYQAIRQGTFPSPDSLSAFFRIFSVEGNSPLSASGYEQLQEMRHYLNSKQFWQERFAFDMCLYSPYERSSRSSFSVIPSLYHDKCVPLKELKDLTLYERFFQSNKLDEQVSSFCKYLFHLNDGSKNKVKRLVVFGHSRHFHRLFSLHCIDSERLSVKELPKLMRNCDVWKSTYSYDSSNIQNFSFSSPKLVYRSPLAHANANNDNLFNFSWFKKSSSPNPNTGETIRSRKSVDSSSSSCNEDEENALPVDLLLQSEEVKTPESNNSNSTDNSPHGADSSTSNEVKTVVEEEEEEPTCRICQV